MVDQTLTNFLEKLGIEAEPAKIYLYLVGKTTQTAHQIAKNVEIPKTTVYRRLEELIKIGLVTENIDEYKKEYAAAPIENLSLLVGKRDIEAKELLSQLPHISQLLTLNQTNQDPETKVLFYRGRDGIQQMNWNALKAKEEILGYTYRAWEEIVGKEFVQKFLEEYSLSKFSIKELYSDSLEKSWDNTKYQHYNWPRWQGRYLSPKILDINHQMDIYNNVVAIYNWHDGEIFGVEIYNQKVATMQKQIFEVLWKLGKPAR
jgi:sugar-specific transcriptional regulator TrmB